MMDGRPRSAHSLRHVSTAGSQGQTYGARLPLCALHKFASTRCTKRAACNWATMTFFVKVSAVDLVLYHGLSQDVTLICFRSLRNDLPKNVTTV